jgi:hypothetical protein
MNLVFEINHPAQAHLFKNLIVQLQDRQHKVSVLIKQHPIVESIFQDSDIPYTILGRKRKGLILKGLFQIGFILKILKLYQKHKFQIGIGVSVSLAFLSRFTRLKAIILDDDDKKATPLFAALTHKRASVLFRPMALTSEEQFPNTIYYNAYHEIAYLHPKYFKPDPEILKVQNLKSDEPFFIIRLVSLKAHHDKGIRGLNNNHLKTIIELLQPFGKVLITNESTADFLPGAEKIKIEPANIHHLMAFARLVISDGQTMCSEAACLGVPSVRINDFAGRISYLEEQEKKWKLTFGYSPDQFSAALNKIEELLHEPMSTFQQHRDLMLNEVIDFTAFLVWFVENYPESKRIMKETPDYQYNFR